MGKIHDLRGLFCLSINNSVVTESTRSYILRNSKVQFEFDCTFRQ